MNESLRQDYLSALGIDVWYARVSLPGAAPSPEFPLDKPQERSLPEAAPVTPQSPGKLNPADSLASVKERPARPRLVEALSQPDAPTGVSSDRQQKPDKVEVAAVRSQEQGPVINESLNLGVWGGSRWVLIADWQKEASAELQHHLANNILRAMGDSPVPQPGRLLWPAFNHPEIPGRTANNLQTVVQQILGPVPRERINFIVLGAQSEKLIACGFWRENMGIQVCQPFTLADMAADGQLKRQLWESLQELPREH